MIPADPSSLALWTDDSLLAINKPAGLLTLPDGYQPHLPHVIQVLAPIYGRLWIVHRLDKETSGVLLLARSVDAHRSLNLQFDRREVAKTYHAILSGCPPWQYYEIDAPLRANGDRRHRTVVDRKRGKPAQTKICLLERFPANALVEALPRTGRTHQIRVHLAHTGFPILGDLLYTAQNVQPTQLLGETPIQRPALHARSIRLRHPLSGDEIEFSAPYPPDFQIALENLGGG